MTRRNVFSLASAGIVVRRLLGSTASQSSSKDRFADVLPATEGGKKLKVVFVGAHVDDWVVAAGTLARYTRLGHEAVCYSFTPGDSRSMAFMHKMPLEKLATQRVEEGRKGAEMVGAKFKVLDQHNQNMQLNPEVYDRANKVLAEENPDVVFTMWALEFHPDHRAVANITFNAWLQLGLKFRVFFCETNGGGEMTSQLFRPTRYVDIGAVRDLKRRAHNVNTFIRGGWEMMDLSARFRGAEYGCQYAEAFVGIDTVARMPQENLYPNRWFYGGLRLAPHN
jgi:LmbE family N-acetylglucosaminyl deacetylase